MPNNKEPESGTPQPIDEKRTYVCADLYFGVAVRRKYADLKKNDAPKIESGGRD